MSFEIVKIGNVSYLSQLEDLPAKISGEGFPAVVVDTSGKGTSLEIEKSQANYPYSVYVTSVVDNHGLPHTLSKARKRIEFNRYPKFVQGMLLLEYAKEHQLTSAYKHLHTFMGNDAIVSPFVPAGKYVIKPENGARSMAIVHIDTSKLTTLEFQKNMHRIKARADYEYSLKGNESKNDGPTLDDPSKPTSNKDESAADIRTRLFLEFLNNKGMKYKLGSENRQNEAVDVFFQQGKVVQEAVPFNDFVEFRALRSMQGKVLIVTREDLDVNWMGTTQIVNEDNFVKLIDGNSNNKTMYDDIVDFISHPEFPGMYGSVDIWVNAKERCWGIFEFQPQYDASNIPPNEHLKFMKECVFEFIQFAK